MFFEILLHICILMNLHQLHNVRKQTVCIYTVISDENKKPPRVFGRLVVMWSGKKPSFWKHTPTSGTRSMCIPVISFVFAPLRWFLLFRTNQTFITPNQQQLHNNKDQESSTNKHKQRNNPTFHTPPPSKIVYSPKNTIAQLEWTNPFFPSRTITIL